MGKYCVKVLATEYLNVDVKRFVIERPLDYKFIPGQGTEVAINKPGWDDQFRPFTFTNLESDDHLEFIIKIYKDHQGVTHELGKVNAGGELIIQEAFGAITYQGPGVFLAGGSGITPFLSIFRKLHKEKTITGNRLIYSNRTEEDVILVEELNAMLGEQLIYFFSHENTIGFTHHQIDRAYLIEAIRSFDQYFYVCGPDSFVKDISKILVDLGVQATSLVVEQ
ncbi:MAG: flavodoxin reductase [Bacteroidota bacterium]|nr:flavodoxin reductase [Bacteroidota bacterium]